MIEFNKNYLGHDFIFKNHGQNIVREFCQNNDYICSKCNIVVAHYYRNEIRVIKIDDRFKNLKLIGGTLDLTCDEVIIKGIIE